MCAEILIQFNLLFFYCFPPVSCFLFWLFVCNLMNIEYHHLLAAVWSLRVRAGTHEKKMETNVNHAKRMLAKNLRILALDREKLEVCLSFANWIINKIIFSLVLFFCVFNDPFRIPIRTSGRDGRSIWSRSTVPSCTSRTRRGRLRTSRTKRPGPSGMRCSTVARSTLPLVSK